VRVTNVLTCELPEGPGREGFAFRGAAVGPLIGGRRIGAAVYEAVAGVPIWPYHYHYPSEEWLYVLEGSPVLRDPAGRRQLTPGDLACFPAGHRGAHTLEGPGRFIIFSAEERGAPGVSVYPDSDKLSVHAGEDPRRLNALILPREAAVDYWCGEGEGPVDSVPVQREPPGESRRVANAWRTGLITIGEAGEPPSPASAGFGVGLGAEQLDVAVTVLEPGQGGEPYRYVWGREQWALVLAGTVVVRHRDGEDVLRAGEMTCFAEGPDGARHVDNRGREPARVLTIDTTGVPANICYPDTGRWLLRNDRSYEITLLRELAED
jgi:uncharacterized cupin superfamily protein